MSFSIILEHFYVVLVAVVLTIIIGLPLGVLAYFKPSFRKVVMWIVDVLQTIPALALLGIIMVFLGAGKLTVITGLFLYSLLPIVHNTCLGLTEVDPAVKEAARGMGMTKFHSLVRVELPLAFPVIFTGIRIASVTAIGVAVFSAFVGGGGLGTIIYRGIYIQNMRLLMSGTCSLMAMAVIIDFVMAYVEKRLYRRTS